MGYTRCHLAAVFVAVLLLTSFSPAGESAITPEQLVQELAKAAKNGDADAFLSHLTTESRKAVGESLEDLASFRRSQENFQHALSERFGEVRPNLNLPAKDFKSVLRRINGFELVGTKEGQGGALELRVKTSLRTQAEKAGEKLRVHEDTFIARKENGAWKLVLNPGNSINMMAEKSALDRVAAGVRNGEFRDARSALAELSRVRVLEPASNVERGVALGTRNPSQSKPHPAGEVAVPGASSAAISVHQRKVPTGPN